MVKAVFLDLDGMLTDTNYLHFEAWAQAFEEVEARPPRSRIHHEVGQGPEKLMTEFVEDDQKAGRVSELHSEYYAQLQERGHCLPGAKQLVASQVERGYGGWLATQAPSPRNWSTACRKSGQRARSRGSSLRTRPRSSNPLPPGTQYGETLSKPEQRKSPRNAAFAILCNLQKRMMDHS